MQTLRNYLFVAILSLIIPLAAAQTSVQAIALFNNKAMLSINGQRARIINAGDTYQGVTLMEATTEHAIIKVDDGPTETLTLSSTVVLTKSLGPKPAGGPGATVQLWADANGFFRSDGAINGRSMEFLIDTGANLVVLSSRHADNVGLDYESGLRSVATTASGTTPIFLVELDQISVAGIELRDIQAGVIIGNFPAVPLLGMSFLSRVNMNRVGNVMELKQRF